MMSTLQKVDALYDMAAAEQENGTAKLSEAGVDYNDGTIQGVMEHIPTDGGGKVYTNGFYTDSAKIDPATVTAVFNSEIQFCSQNEDIAPGLAIAERLAINDEHFFESEMRKGWTSGLQYKTEYIAGMYAGYSWEKGKNIFETKIWMSNYPAGPNGTTLYVVVQYRNAAGEWIDKETISLTTTLPFPNVFEIPFDPTEPIYGVRWIHLTPQKQPATTVDFYGMNVYEIPEEIPVYIPEISSSMIPVPDNYGGFGTLYLSGAWKLYVDNAQVASSTVVYIHVEFEEELPENSLCFFSLYDEPYSTVIEGYLYFAGGTATTTVNSYTVNVSATEVYLSWYPYARRSLYIKLSVLAPPPPPEEASYT